MEDTHTKIGYGLLIALIFLVLSGGGIFYGRPSLLTQLNQQSIQN